MSETDDKVCPDGGRCHHECSFVYCFRVAHAGPLSGIYDGDEWPLRVRLALDTVEAPDLGAEYLKAVTKPIVLTPEDEDKVAELLQPTMPVRLACCHEWKASRVDTVHESVPVRHVCNEHKGHDVVNGVRVGTSPHKCSCGATMS